ncbi:MAG TPA: APC family permease [Acidimicrobiales bacterium]|nr:APC family permease [Acidimicrobiales bacterium]
MASDAALRPLGLKENAVGLWGDFVVSIANVAPSSSVAYTLALLVGFAGRISPLAVLVTGVAMFLVAMGYASLNKWKAHAGAPYVWVGEAISPTVGVGTGFLNVFVSTFANVGNITLAGAYLLFVLFPTRTFSNPVTWLVATAVMGILVWLSIRGIRPSVQVQTGLIVIEYTAMISFVILALIHEASGAGGATLPSLSDFTISRAVAGVGGFKGLAEAAVPCGFLYLGWEATAVLGEESTRREINPGRAMLLGTGFLTVWYTFLIVVFEGVSNQAAVLKNGTDVLAWAGPLLVPGFLGRALPLAVLVAVIGTCQIQMTEPSRILFALARDRLIPRVFAFINRAHHTPWAGLLILAAIPPVLLIPYLENTSANHAIGDIISADGMFGLFMYFVIAVSSVWFYKSHLRKSTAHLLGLGLLPLLGGLFMGVIFFYGLTTQTAIVAWVSLAGVALAFAIGVLVVWRAAPTSPFFVDVEARRRSGRMEEATAAEALPARPAEET